MAITTDIAVIGGGIIGLSTAWRLAQRGASVTVIERGRIGGEASGAAAGMLAPFAEATSRGAFSDLGLASLNRYAAFVDELRTETQIDPELVRTGLLRVANLSGDADLRATYGAMRQMGSSAAWVDYDRLREMEPALSDDITSAIYSPTEWQVEPRKLLSAVSVAAAKRGVRIVENTQVIGFERERGRVAGLETTAGSVACSGVLIAGGAWNQSIAGWLGARVPVTPLRGQIAALGPCLPMPLRHTIYAHHGYLVPKSDGRVIVGSTEDDAGFDKRTTAVGISTILARAIALAPCLANAPLNDTWAGLRPMSADRLPVLGKLNSWDNVFVAAGHFRNGILLTPITAELMADLILSGSAVIDGSFCPDRFAQ